MSNYIVALSAGGIMESPEIYHDDFQIINAQNETLAIETYNKKNDCHYFYGDVVAIFEYDDWKIIDNKITKYQLESFLYNMKNKSL